MAERANPAPADEIAAVLAWWRDAGVDWQYSDDPADWLESSRMAASDNAGPKKSGLKNSSTAPNAVAEPKLAPPADAALLATLPTDLASFREWWMAEPLLDSGQVSGRVPPRGNAGPALMVIVEQPEDADSDRLLSGPQGKLLDAMLAAMGLAQDEVNVASVLPRTMPFPDWSALSAQGIGKVLVRHIALVAPQRIMALGGSIWPLMGNNPPLSADILRQFNHEGGTIPAFAGKSLLQLLERPRWKAAFWRNWLDWPD